METMDKESYKQFKCLVVLSGIPACGKTSLAKLMLKQLGNISTQDKSKYSNEEKETLDQCGVLVISYDELIPNDIPMDDICHQRWKEYREEVILCIDQLLDKSSLDKMTKPSCLTDALWDKFYNIVKDQISPVDSAVIVIDDNMYYTSMRHRYFQLARQHRCGFCQILLTCSVEEALQRNKNRNNPVPPDVIVTMAAKLEAPNIQYNYWERNTLIINTETDVECPLKKISGLITTAMKNPVEPLEATDPNVIAESRQISSTNVIHQSDQILRKIVSERMRDLKSHFTDKETLQYLSKKYIDVRKTCLEKIKTGQVTFPVAVDKPDVACDINSELYQQILRLFEQFIQDFT